MCLPQVNPVDTGLCPSLTPALAPSARFWFLVSSLGIWRWALLSFRTICCFGLQLQAQVACCAKSLWGGYVSYLLTALCLARVIREPKIQLLLYRRLWTSFWHIIYSLTIALSAVLGSRVPTAPRDHAAWVLRRHLGISAAGRSKKPLDRLFQLFLHHFSLAPDPQKHNQNRNAPPQSGAEMKRDRFSRLQKPRDVHQQRRGAFYGGKDVISHDTH